MTEKTQNLSIRLLREGLAPEDSVRSGVTLAPWAAFEGAKLATGRVGGEAPGWTDFLELSTETKGGLKQRFAFGLAFLKAEERWFALSFGMGHTKLDPAAFEQDFGLRVVLNAVDHKKLRSADVRTPDANTLNRRAQTSRGAERTAFEIDPERDIVRGLLGEPKDKKFAARISGNDGLIVRRKAKLADLPAICVKAFELRSGTAYQAEFGWIDQIRHVREPDMLKKLDAALAAALTAALTVEPSEVDDLSLAYPVIYDPDKTDWVRFRGYSAKDIFPDLEIEHYLAGLKAKGFTAFDVELLDRHQVQECDDQGQVNGQSWPIRDCLVFETDLEGGTYTLSGGRWYRIDADLANQVRTYFDNIRKVSLPDAKAGDNEKRYNERLKGENNDLLFMDAQLVKPSDSSSPIEVCDFIGKDRRLVHIKDKSESSRLSHLFNQGMVSAVVLKRDGAFRDLTRALIAKQPGGADYADLVPDSSGKLTPSDFTVVYGVLVNGASKAEPKLPFFSLISFRHAATRIADELGYKVAFAWIKKPAAGTGKKAIPIKKAA